LSVDAVHETEIDVAVAPVFWRLPGVVGAWVSGTPTLRFMSVVTSAAVSARL